MKEPLDYDANRELDLRFSLADILRIAVKLAVGVIVVGAILFSLLYGLAQHGFWHG